MSICCFVQTVGNYFKSYDMYGHPVGLQYDGDTKYKSYCGGCATFLTGLLTLIYFLKNCESVSNKISTIKDSEKFINTLDDLNEYQLNSSMFDLGYELYYFGDLPGI